MKNPIRTGTMIAMTAATLFAGACGSKAAPKETAAPAAMEKTAATVHCQGINECKGTAACKTATNECKGMNGCKGQGWVEVSAEDCTAKNGKVAE